MEYDEKTMLLTKGIVKKFPGVIALKGIDFELYEREIHALAGQNGSGKTTFLRIINGILQPDAGEIYIKGQKVYFKSPLDAKKFGITMIHQEATLIPNLSIAENIFLDIEVPFKRFNLVKKDDLVEKAKEYLEHVGLMKDPLTKVKELRAAERQLVQVARALAREEEIKIICMDEPTSALSRGEIVHLFNLMEDLKKRGKSIIFVTHRIEEIFEVADRVTILRDGNKVITAKINEISPKDVVKLMIGKDIESIHAVRRESERTIIEYKTPILVVRHLYTVPSSPTETALKDISFELYEGEILGVTGLLGSGKTELGKALIGLSRIVRGEIRLYGKKVDINSSSMARKLGIVYVPEDRLREGLVLGMNVKDNIILPSITRISMGKLIRRIKLENEKTKEYIKILNIVPPNPLIRVDALSGGNKQKVVIAKFIETSPRIFIFDEPTFGIDVGAKFEIRSLIASLVGERSGVILLSSDIDEVLSLSDRIMVLRDGKAIGIYNKKELNREKLIDILSSSSV
jgi:ribose transport system ATP-binding protein